MADIKTVLQEMINIGEDPIKIQEVADKYKEANPGWSVTASIEDDPIAKSESQADVAVTEKNTASNGVEDSTDYEFQTQGDKKAWGRSVAGGEMEVVDASEIPENWFNDPKFKEVYDQQSKIEEEKEPSTLSAIASSLGVSFVEFQKGNVSLKEAITLGTFELANKVFGGDDLTGTEKVGVTAAMKAMSGGGSDKFDPIIEKLEENIPKFETASITKDLEDGNYKQAGYRAVLGGFRSAPSLVMAGLGPGGLIALATSVAGNKFEEEFEADPEESTGKLLAASSVAGVTEATFELVTRRLLMAANLIKATGGATAAKEVIEGGVKEIIKKIGGATLAEGTSEAATELVSKTLADYAILGKEFNRQELYYAMGDGAIVGSMIGGSIQGVGSIKNTSNRAKERAEAILMPEDAKNSINLDIESLNSLMKDLPKAEGSGKKAIEDEIDTIEQKVIKTKRDANTLVGNLEGKNFTKYAKAVDNINKNKEILKNAKTESEKVIASKNLNALKTEAVDILKDSQAKASSKEAETIRETIKKSGLDGNVSEMTSEEISSIKEEGFDSKSAASQFGYIKQKTDGSFDIVLNKDKPMVGVAAHEFMHAVLFKTIGNNTEIQNNLGDALIDHTSKLGGETSILGERLSNYGNWEGNTFKRDANFGEETITIMSESIVNGSLKFDENFFTKVGDVIRRFSQNYLGKEITFDNGRDVYNFIKDYSKNVKDGKINKAILKVAKEGAKGKLVEGKVEAKAGTQMAKTSPEKLVRIIKNSKKTTKEIRAAENDLTEQFDLLALKALKYDTRKGDISRDAVRDEARKYLPGIIKRFNPTTSKFSTFVNSNMAPKQAVIYEKVKGLTYGDTVSIDTKEARQVEDTSAETTQKGPDTRRKKTNVLKIGKVERKADAIRKIVKVKEGDTFKEVSDNNTGKVAQEIFDVPADKITDPKKNLTYAKKIVEGIPEASEAGDIQSFYTDPQTAEKLIKILPEESVSSDTADINEIGENIDVDREVLGRGLGLNNRMLNYFYEKTNKRSKGKTSQPFIWKLKSEFKNLTPENVRQFQENLGITPRGELNNYNRNIGQLLKGVAKFQAQQTALSTAQRILTEQKASKKQIASVTAAQSKVAFSKAAAQINILSVFELETKGIDKLLKQYGIDGVFSLKNENEIDEYIAAIKKDLLPLMPKEFWFGKSGGTVFTGSSKVLGTSDASKKLYKEYYEPAMKALANDAGVKFGEDIKGVNDYSISSYKTIFKDTKTIKANIKNGKIKAWNTKVALIHEAMWFRMGGAIGKDKNKAKVIGNYMKMTGSDTKHWHKRGAQFVGYSVKPQLRYEYEHAMPATAAYLYLMDAALSKSDFKASYKVVKNNYKLMALDKAMDKKLTAVGLQRSMPKGWDLLENNWWDRYFNSLVASQEGGIDPSSIKTINGKTFGEEFNVNTEGNSSIVKAGIQYSKALNNSIAFSRSANNPTKGITVLDFDDTLATSKSSVLWTAPDGTTGKLTAEEFAKQGADLLAQGYVYDFSEFNKVVKGKKAPLFEKALKLQSKFGPENMFILTARPAESAASIFEFVKANGLNIPLKNITGLANSTPESKALWMVDKVSEGYNDFYFADDALQNVQAVDNILEQFDVKRKVQQARIKFSKSMNEGFNDILENVTGIESEKRFSIIKGRKRGESKGKFRFFIPPSHEDFVGLLYNFMGKGKEGDKHRDFFEQALVRPLNRANREYDTARQSIATDYKALNKQFPEVKEIITKKTPDGDFTNEDAIRIYLWNKYGYKIPGLSPTDQTKLVELVEQDAGLKAYAETLNVISKQDAYVNPTEGWNAGDIRMDLDDATGRVGREQYFNEFNENADVIFSQENLNKIEAGYGKGVVVALQDILYRIKTGRNRPSGSNETVNRFMNFLNGSVGTVMFFNMRSALLQQMSIVNYINFADNNIFAAAKAFANQKQYWKDFAFIFNSDMLKQRRGGIQTDVNGAELAASLRKSKNPSRVLISKLLELGFLPTQIGDNIAIATGGAAYYRNRINKYVKDGLSAKEAEAAAFTDFQNLTQSTQQSARPDMVSMQQASVIGKVILNFQNVTSQFNRLGKKAFQDIYNRRITKPNSTQMQSDISNAARITYYFAVQNAIFYTLQTALFAMMFDDDEEDNNKLFLKKKERLINGSIDSVLRGTGVIGAIVSTLKNTAIAFARQRDVNYNPDESAVVVEALNLSPVIGIKARQIVNAEKTLNYNKKIIDEMSTFDIDNPQWSAVTNYTQALTNLPLNRLYNKTQNVRQALNNDHSAWQRSLMFLGWSQYNLDLKNQKMEDIKADVKVKAKIKSKEKQQIKKEEKKQEKERLLVEEIKEEKKQEKEGKLKDPKCSGVKSDGSRCGISVEKAGDKCTIHETAEQNKTGKKSQCKKIKKGGKRCGMQTSNKSGFCYYHD